MKTVFDKYKGTLITHTKYIGIVCGYSETHFLLAVETTDESNFFRALKKENIFILEEYKDEKYRYIFEDENVIEKQISQQQWLKDQKKRERDSKKP